MLESIYFVGGERLIDLYLKSWQILMLVKYTCSPPSPHIVSLLFKYGCFHFPPTTPLHPSHPPFPPFILPSLVLSMCPLYMFLKTLPVFPPVIPSHLPSGYCQFVLNFNAKVYFFYTVYKSLLLYINYLGRW